MKLITGKKYKTQNGNIVYVLEKLEKYNDYTNCFLTRCVIDNTICYYWENGLAYSLIEDPDDIIYEI